LQSLIDAEQALGSFDSDGIDAASAEFCKLIRAAVASSTWQKYESGWRAFCEFEKDSELYHDWPLPATAFRAFAVWCYTTRNLQPSTIKAYVSAVKFAHRIKGLTAHDTKNDPIFQLIMSGARNLGFLKPPTPSNRRVVTFPLLLVLGSRLAESNWDPISKQVIWAASTTAFFSSARLGELLATTTNTFDPVSDLTWNDVKFDEHGSILIHLKVPKSGDRNGEFLDLFPFLGYNCCPVAALQSLWTKQKEAGFQLGPDPVFRFRSGRNLTPRMFNSVLMSLLQDICGDGNIISCHSFRAGVPSTLSIFPELASSDDVKGWGRWKSDCYTRYTRLRLDQREKIFGRIAEALKQSVA